MMTIGIGNHDKKMLFYSGHDVNIEAILSTFNLTSYDCVEKNSSSSNCIKDIPFASQIILELEKNP